MTLSRSGPKRWWATVLAVATLAGLAAAAACGEETAEPGDGGPKGEVVVFAASSLTDAFREAAARFEQIHPGSTVRLNLASSAALATQINEGAPADVFASADLAQMEVVAGKGKMDEPRMFATNDLVVVTPRDGTTVRTFEDLAANGGRLILAAKDVPIGRYAREVLANGSAPSTGIAPDFGERVLANLRSEEANARAVLAKVVLGEADAGIVYRTDALAAGDAVRTIEIPTRFYVVASYPIAALSDAGNATLARAWIAFIVSAEGQAILVRHGFGVPR